MSWYMYCMFAYYICLNYCANIYLNLHILLLWFYLFSYHIKPKQGLTTYMAVSVEFVDDFLSHDL